MSETPVLVLIFPYAADGGVRPIADFDLVGTRKSKSSSKSKLRFCLY